MPEIRDKVQSAGTAAQVLKALGRLAEPSPLSQVAAEAGMPAAKAHRYLQALIDAGLAEQDAGTGRYGMGPEIIGMGLAALGRVDLVGIASPEMHDLRDRIGHTCLLSIWGTHGPTVVRVAQTPTAITIVTRLGSVLPLASATGYVFAAHLAPARLKLASDYAAFNRSLKGGSANAQAVRCVRDTGVASIDGIVVPGISALAAPIFDAFGQCEGVLTALGPAGSFDAAPDGPCADQLRASARHISWRMGSKGDAAS